jgi:thymidylate kinase
MNILEDFFNQLNKENISYCVLRNYHSLPQSTGGSDLDIWVSSLNTERFLKIIQECSAKHSGKVVSYIWKRFGPKICILGNSWGVQIDVYKDVIPIKEYIFITSDTIIQHIDYYNEVHILSNNWSAIITLLKEILNTKSCRRKHNIYPDAQKALSVIDKDELKASLHMFSSKFIDELVSIANRPYSDAIVKRIYQLGIMDLKKQKGIIRFDRIKKWFRLFRRPGYMIVILGTDGSGKSTIIEAITPILEGAFHNGIHYKHLRPHLIPDLGIMIGKREKQDGLSPHPHAKKPSDLISSLIRWGYYMFDYTVGYFCKIYPDIGTHADVFVMDRYYYDYYVDQKRLLINLPTWIIHFGEIFIPKPDLILCLGGDPGVFFNRKPETSLGEVDRQIKALKKFCETRKNTVWIDTGCSVVESVDKSMRAIVDMMSSRFQNLKAL